MVRRHVQVKVTTETVRRVAAHAQRLTAGVHGLAFVSKPGQALRYVDKHPSVIVFTDRDAARRAAAFYAGIVDGLQVTNPPLVDRVLQEVDERHTASVDVGRGYARRYLVRQVAVRQAARGLPSTTTTTTTRRDGEL